jgi:ribosomal protein S11
VKVNTPGIDGEYVSPSGQRTPVSLKGTASTNPYAVVQAAVKAAKQAAAAGYHGVEVYIEALNLSAADVARVAAGGPMARLPQQGVVSVIYVRCADGVVVVDASGIHIQ